MTRAQAARPVDSDCAVVARTAPIAARFVQPVPPTERAPRRGGDRGGAPRRFLGTVPPSGTRSKGILLADGENGTVPCAGEHKLTDEYTEEV